MPRPTPHEEIQARLRAMLGPRVAALPKRWERLGDVLVVRFHGAGLSEADARAAAAVYADVIGARVVLDDRGGIKGALREPDVVRLHGEGSAETLHVQDGIQYRIDPERVMWSSGNMEERRRMGAQEAAGETVVDLFAGIGYFTLPLLVNGRAARVIACELNPVSARLLAENGALNGVGERLEVRPGDCREVAPRESADRVVLGWFPGGHHYLDVALAALRPQGGLLHYHDTAKADAPGPELVGHLERAMKGTPWRLGASTCRIVKSYAPGVVHAVLDARIVPRAAAVPSAAVHGTEATA